MTGNNTANQTIVAGGIRDYYTDILSQSFSPCGNFLAAASIYGHIHIFDLSKILSPPEGEINNALKPILTFKPECDQPASSLLSTEKFLIAGYIGQIFGFEWKYITSGKEPKVSFCWQLPSEKNNFDGVSINALAIQDNNVYVGCDDKRIHVFSLEDGRQLKSLEGHTDYVHDLINTEQNGIASASEDGSVRFWDLRTRTATSKLEPWKNKKLDRPSLGKWVGTLRINSDWLLCGGGVTSALWHIGSMQCLESFSNGDFGVHACMIHEDNILIGEGNKLNKYSIQGDLISSISSSSQTILSLVYEESPHTVLSISGNSPKLDICTNLDYRDSVVSCW